MKECQYMQLHVYKHTYCTIGAFCFMLCKNAEKLVHSLLGIYKLETQNMQYTFYH